MSSLSLDQAFARAADLEARGQGADACRIYRDILRDDPKNREALRAVSTILNGVVALYENGRFEDVVLQGNALKEVLPNSAALWNVVAAADQALVKLEDAARGFERTLELKPELPSGHNNLGVALRDLGRYAESETAYRRSQVLCPDYADPYVNLANGLKNRGQIPDAIRLYERALMLEPDNAPARTAKLYQQAQICDFSWWHEFRNVRESLGLKTGKVPPFAPLFMDDDPEAQHIRARNWARRTADPDPVSGK